LFKCKTDEKTKKYSSVILDAAKDIFELE